MSEENHKEIPRIGVFVCHCGINIGGIVDVSSVAEYAKTLPGVAFTEDILYTCSSDGIKDIKEAIEKHALNRIVVASCTPRTHELLFRETCEEAGLNKYLFQMANIREHCSWVHMQEPEEATKKAKDLVRMAVAKAWYLEPQEESEVKVTPESLIIGAGISGMHSALCLANQGFKVHLVEKEPEVGGMLRKLHKLYPTDESAGELVDSVAKAVKVHNNITLYTTTLIKDVKGYIGNFEVIAEQNGKDQIEFNVGTIIVATGTEEFKPMGMYNYGNQENIITQLELEQRLQEGFSKRMDKIVMIQCVGAMDENEGVEYCSRICCATALKNALLIKESNPNADIYILYRQLQSYGDYEKYYIRAQERNIKFINYLPENRPRVEKTPNGMRVNVYNPLVDKEISINSDLVVLSTPLVQHEWGRALSPLLKVPLGSDGFFLEAHVKLKPVDFATDGIFVCGTAHSPKTIDESIAQAYGAASSAAIPMARGHVRTEAITAVIDESLCRGCGNCRETCEYNAIELEERIFEVKPFTRAPILTARVNEVVCKGCGSCSVTCPTSAISMKHFTNRQILAEIDAAYGG